MNPVDYLVNSSAYFKATGTDQDSGFSIKNDTLDIENKGKMNAEKTTLCFEENNLTFPIKRLVVFWGQFTMTFSSLRKALNHPHKQIKIYS